MTLSLLAALGSVACYGVASVLQAHGARRTISSVGVDPRLLARLAMQRSYVAGLALDVVAAVCTVIALRRLPLFIVQAAVASSVAVTAVLASRVFGNRLARGEWAGIGLVMVGLALLAVTAGPEAPPSTALHLRVGLLAVAVLLVAMGAAAGRLRGPSTAALLGAIAGSAFGVGNTGIRVLVDLSPLALVRNPAAWAAAIAGVTGLLLFATALQRGSVTSATGLMTATETLLPAAFGLLVLGERPRHGLVAVAVLGFTLTILGALSLSRFGEVEPARAPAPQPADRRTGPRAP
ncbi:MAG: rane protein [Acidimicrobiales bacterium]|nr:rane protein [Acidimicrobiales bacterium]